MRHALVLADEAARHPFRRQLPPLGRGKPMPRRTMPPGGLIGAYCASFLATLVFLG